MKLATFRDGSRDGQLIVVSRDLTQAHFATGIATRMQQLLDDWNFVSPQLEDLYTALNHGKARHAFAPDPRTLMAPLPRAAQWVQAPGYAAGDAEPGALPALRRAAADSFFGPLDDAPWPADEALDCGAGLAVATGDLAQGASPEAALESVRLLLLCNDWLRPERAPAEAALALSTAFGPVAVTPDELGAAWQHGRVAGTLAVQLNGKPLGRLETGPEMRHPFGTLLAQLAAGRALGAGSLLGSGPVRNADPAHGVACLADKREREAAEHGEPRSGWLQPGDRVRIEFKGRDGHSVFGAIEQRVAAPAG